jgi:HB1, ASXL, restriction endonuclease HTH domain
MTEKLTTRAAIEHVFNGKRKPISVPAIFEEAFPLTGLAGQTPKQTFYSIIHSEKRRPDGVVVQVGPGLFKLNPKRRRG